MEMIVEEGYVVSAMILPRPKLLRYALLSGIKFMEEKHEANAANPSAPGRGRSTPTVWKSMGVLDQFAKEKSAMTPLRRMSIPAKVCHEFVVQACQQHHSNIRSWTEVVGKDETPIGEPVRSSAMKKALRTSTKYWVSQIKISEQAAQHLVSLGFFKVAVEAGYKAIILIM